MRMRINHNVKLSTTLLWMSTGLLQTLNCTIYLSIYLTILVGHLLSHVTETNDGDKIEEITDNFPTINVNKEVGSRIYNCWSAILFTHFLVIN